jgi:hypothetical protein
MKQCGSRNLNNFVLKKSATKNSYNKLIKLSKILGKTINEDRENERRRRAKREGEELRKGECSTVPEEPEEKPREYLHTTLKDDFQRIF